MTTIPANLSDFLFWVKEQTELFWSIDPKTSTNDFVCEEWAYGAKWIGLTDEQIDQVEAKYEIRFLPEHREFLRILHAIDRRERIEYEDEDEIVVKERPFFYNWLEDEAEIKRRLNWPFETIFEDVEGANKFWLKSWGIKPKMDEEKKEIFARWYN